MNPLPLGKQIDFFLFNMHDSLQIWSTICGEDSIRWEDESSSRTNRVERILFLIAVMRLDTVSIDGLRGLAALHVALGHMFIFSQEPTQGTDFMGGASMGLFFIISGFVMTLGYGKSRYSDSGGMCCECCCTCCDQMYCCIPRPLGIPTSGISQQTSAAGHGGAITSVTTLEPADSASVEMNAPIESDGAVKVPFPTKMFLTKRIGRLFPMYYLTNLIAIPLWFLLTPNLAAFVVTFVLSLFMVTSWVGIAPLNGVLWTISTMLFFYLCFPCLIVRLQQFTRTADIYALNSRMYVVQLIVFFVVFVLALLVGAVGAVYQPWRQFPPARLPVFVMGCCIGLLRMNHHHQQGQEQGQEQGQVAITTVMFPPDNANWPALVFAVNCFIGITCSAAGGGWAILAFFIRLLSEVFFPILFFDWVLIMTRPRKTGEKFSIVEKFFRSDALQFMGRISMSFYMIHLLVLFYVGLIVHRIRTGQAVADEFQQAFIPPYCIPIVLIISLFLGWVLTDYFEAPMSRYITSTYSSNLNRSGGGGGSGNPSSSATQDSPVFGVGAHDTIDGAGAQQQQQYFPLAAEGALADEEQGQRLENQYQNQQNREGRVAVVAEEVESVIIFNPQHTRPH